ncbi:MAG: sigma factor, partial [Bacteroidota bacterium]
MAIRPSLEEKALIEACLCQDRLAQKRLYDKYKKAMFSLAYRMTGNFEDASEVLQDAFVRVFKSLHTFRQDATLGAWIKAILVRVALTKIKRRVQF